jgi:RNA polymerase sigma-70 factor (ECF subfamily)
LGYATTVEVAVAVARMELTDAHVAAAASGDREALAVIYAALAPLVVGYLRAHAVQDPEGVANDVFAKLLPQVPRVTGGAEGLRRLTFAIARARMIDAARARARAGSPVRYEPAADSRRVPSAEDEAHQAASLEHVQAVLATLPADQREVLTLRVVADLSIEQVAELMGRSAGAIKQLQRRGLIALRRALEEGRVTL